MKVTCAVRLGATLDQTGGVLDELLGRGDGGHEGGFLDLAHDLYMCSYSNDKGKKEEKRQKKRDE